MSVLQHALSYPVHNLSPANNHARLPTCSVLQEHNVSNVEVVKQLIEESNHRRSVGSTAANADSSRSHSIMQFALKRFIAGGAHSRLVSAAASTRMEQVCRLLASWAHANHRQQLQPRSRCHGATNRGTTHSSWAALHSVAVLPVCCSCLVTLCAALACQITATSAMHTRLLLCRSALSGCLWLSASCVQQHFGGALLLLQHACLSM